MPHWDDLRTDQTGTGCTAYGGVGCGIFTSTSGTAPNRIFNIEWRTVYFGANTTRANFEVRLYENPALNRFDIVYGEVAQGGSSATVGVQRDTGSFFTQFECNTAGTLTSGLQLVATPPAQVRRPRLPRQLVQQLRLPRHLHQQHRQRLHAPPRRTITTRSLQAHIWPAPPAWASTATTAPSRSHSHSRSRFMTPPTPAPRLARTVNWASVSITLASASPVCLWARLPTP